MARRTLNRMELPRRGRSRRGARHHQPRRILLEVEVTAQVGVRTTAETDPDGSDAGGRAVCDVGGRTVATFDYPQKAEAEALIAKLKGQGKGTHFLRSVKEPISG